MPAPSSPAHPVDPADGRVRIVVVDDHPIVRDALTLRLGKEPDFVVVGTADSSLTALNCVRETQPDVVIMDLHLPDENGLRTTSRIRGLNSQVKILVLTGDTSLEMPQDALLAGANGFMRKAEASDELIRAIRVVLSGKIYLSPDAATAVTQALLAAQAAGHPQSLGERELAVLKGLALGLAYKEIASQLKLSVKSIETYRARLVKKTGCATRADLVRYAIREGIIVA